MSNLYSTEEVKGHNSEQDCWIIVRGKVYDVTKYLDDHPGGVEIVTDLAGMDATEDYDDVGHSEEANEILEKYLIGKVGASSGTTPAKVEAKPAAASVSAAAPKPVAAASAPVAKAAAPVASSSSSKKNNEQASDNTMLIVAGALAVAGLAFFVLRKKK